MRQPQNKKVGGTKKNEQFKQMSRTLLSKTVVQAGCFVTDFIVCVQLMFGLFDAIADWFRGLLIDGIMSNFAGMFNEVNDKVGEIASQVGQTPAGWNAGVFNLIQTLSNTVIIPVAGMILTFVLTYELIHMVIEKNNMHEAVC